MKRITLIALIIATVALVGGVGGCTTVKANLTDQTFEYSQMLTDRAYETVTATFDAEGVTFTATNVLIDAEEAKGLIEAAGASAEQVK